MLDHTADATAARVLGLLLLTIAAVALAVGADVYTSRVQALSARLRVTALAIGLLVAGAEPEELVTAVIAQTHHKPGIAAGDAVGANFTMLTLVLGALAFLQPLPISRRVRSYCAIACAASLLVALLATGGTVSRAEGVVLLVLYVAFAAAVLSREHRTAQRDPDPAGATSPASHALLALAGLGLVTLGGWAAVAGADRVVTGFGFGESAVGLTLVAFATSAELLALIWAARRHRVTELALAALVGSVVGNATATIGAASLVAPLSMHGVVGTAWLVAALSALLVVPRVWEGRAARVAGVCLMAGYALYVTFLLR